MSRLGDRWVAGVLMIGLAVGFATRASQADETTVLDFCIAHPEACALSVEAIDEGWDGHLNPDRPQVLASTFKILVLLAYADSVAQGLFGPDDTVEKEEWARYFSGGTTLETSWNELGQPDRPRLDDLARVMITNSDNSAPDLFLALLQKKILRKSVKRFGWHDTPASISSMFGLWLNLNGVGDTGNRVATDYGGFEAGGYQKELSKHAKSLKDDDFVAMVRRGLCAQPPWVAGSPPCDPVQPFTTEANLRLLENRHFNRSTTRSYATLMRRLLVRDLLDPAAQQVVERNLEAWLDLFPTLSPSFSRYGLKGGNLATSAGNEILTWAHYLETSTGRYVVVVFLQDLGAVDDPPEAADVNAFAQQFALDATFRRAVRDALPGAPPASELAPEIVKVKRKGRSVSVKTRVWNTSPASSGQRAEVALYLVDELGDELGRPVARAVVKALSGYKKKGVTLKATSDDDPKGKLAVLVIDTGDAVAEQDEDNNVTWERIN